MPKECRSTNVKNVPARLQTRALSFGFWISFVIRISSFVIHNAAPPSDRPSQHGGQADSRPQRPCLPAAAKRQGMRSDQSVAGQRGYSKAAARLPDRKEGRLQIPARPFE